MLFDITNYALINTDDDYGRRLAGEVSCAMETYGNASSADYYADAIKLRADGTSFWLCYGGKSYPVNMQMTGMSMFLMYGCLCGLYGIGFVKCTGSTGSAAVPRCARTL